MTAGTPRVVSLVPSATETLIALGVVPIACTRFCEQPEIAHVGGTKDPKVDEIVGLAPDLVVVNDEENRLEDYDALRAAGLELHSMSPHSVGDVGAAVSMLAARVGVPVPAPFGDADWTELVERATAALRGRVVVLIWRRPWMTMDASTYGSSLLSVLGWQSSVSGGADRYPEVTLEQVGAFEPDVVILPTEPYPFAARHVAEVEAGVPTARVSLVDGQDLFWWGIRTPGALEHLSRSDW